MPGLRVNGDALKALRERSGLDQGELASLAQVDRAYISQIESGKRSPSPLVANRIASCLRVPLVAILAEVAEA
jgi:transcriptional regulator with XRE-family HTH domain